MQKHFRNDGAKGALLDEYEKAIKELQLVISDVSQKELVEIVDPLTTDKDCRSIQTILNHVIRAGYRYVYAIRKWLGEEEQTYNQENLSKISDYQTKLMRMFQYNEKLFKDYPDIKLECYEAENKFLVPWGQLYDVEQLLEHAIVHILRHRRQIERFKLKLRSV